MKRLLTISQKRRAAAAAAADLARRENACEPSADGTSVLPESASPTLASCDSGDDTRGYETSSHLAADVQTMPEAQTDCEVVQEGDARPSPESCVQQGLDESDVVDVPLDVQTASGVGSELEALAQCQPDCHELLLPLAETQAHQDTLESNRLDAVQLPSTDQDAIAAAAEVVGTDQTILTVLAALLNEFQAVRKLMEEIVQASRKRASTTKLPKTGLTEEEAQAFAGIRMLTMDHLEELFCAKRSTIYGWIENGKFFDSVHPSSKASRWPVSEVEAWVEKLKRERDESRLQSGDGEN